jgi:catechol 2,3-dioxygenase-like lactoylglutathione lyase family enzyme
MLGDANVQTMLPVKDFKAAKQFYEGTLGLRKVEEMPEGAVTYKCGDGKVTVYVSEYAGTNKGTAAAWEVKDVEKTVQELKGKGVSFEHYDDIPRMTRKGDIHLAGPMKLAWFKDPSGNILGLEGRA